MPVTRNADVAIKSVEADGWTVLSKVDSEKVGANVIRKELLASATEATYIRLADDDDIMLPNREEAIAALVDCDVVYFDYLLTDDGVDRKIRYTGDLRIDCLNTVPPWSWVAKKSALDLVPNLFDPNVKYIHGGYTLFEMIKAGLKIKHVPIFAYHWIRGTNGISSNSGVDAEYNKFQQEVEEYFSGRSR